MSDVVNATKLLEDLRKAVRIADTKLEDVEATQTMWGEKLATLVEAVTVFDDWMSTLGKNDFPEQWLDDGTSDTEETPPF